MYFRGSHTLTNIAGRCLSIAHSRSCFGEVHCGKFKLGQEADEIILENLSKWTACKFNMKQKYLNDQNKTAEMLAIFQNALPLANRMLRLTFHRKLDKCVCVCVCVCVWLGVGRGALRDFDVGRCHNATISSELYSANQRRLRPTTRKHFCFHYPLIGLLDTTLAVDGVCVHIINNL